jgi:hypothetical protein
MKMMIFVASTILVFLAAGINVHAASETPIAFVASIVPAGPPGTFFIDEDGVTHIRNFPFVGSLSGDLNGVTSVLFNANIDAFGNGDSFGSSSDVTAEGTWECRFSGVFTFGIHSGSTTCIGTGGNSLRYTATYAQTSPPGAPPPFVAAFSGTLLDPHG